MVGKHIFLSGKVQGVGLRFHTHEKAFELSLRGWVRNLPDGRVEIIAYGEDNDMAAFLEWLKTGSSAARVENIEVLELKRRYYRDDFYIRRDGGPTWPEDS